MESPRIRTGYSFRAAAGKIEEVLDALEGRTYAPITDRASTFGFYRWQKAALARGLKPVFGVELAVTNSINEKKPSFDYWTFIAGDDISAINTLVEQATMQFRYQPLLTLEQALSAPVTKITGHRTHPSTVAAQDGGQGLFYGLGPSTPRAVARAVSEAGLRWAAVSDNRYPRPADRGYYELVCGRNAETQSYDQFIQTEEEWRASIAHLALTGSAIDLAMANSKSILGSQTAQLRKAHLPEPDRPDTIESMCRAAAADKNINLEDPVYEARLRKEIDLISAKGYDDYFYIVADICQWARKRMMVGPARGSSCGSLVCYLLDITTIDPIPHGLIFERFIDINRGGWVPNQELLDAIK